MGGEWNFIHSPPIFRAQSCLTDAVIVIFPDYCFTDTHLTQRGAFHLTGRPSSQGAVDGAQNRPQGRPVDVMALAYAEHIFALGIFQVNVAHRLGV